MERFTVFYSIDDDLDSVEMCNGAKVSDLKKVLFPSLQRGEYYQITAGKLKSIDQLPKNTSVQAPLIIVDRRHV